MTMSSALEKDKILVDLTKSPTGSQYIIYNYTKEDPEYIQFNVLGREMDNDGLVEWRVSKFAGGERTQLTITTAGRNFLALGGYKKHEKREKRRSVIDFLGKSINWMIGTFGTIATIAAAYLANETNDLKNQIKKQETVIDSLK